MHKSHGVKTKHNLEERCPGHRATEATIATVLSLLFEFLGMEFNVSDLEIMHASLSKGNS